MPAPSRDRLPRPVDISTLFRGAARRVNLIVDEPGLLWSGLSANPVQNGSVTQVPVSGSGVGQRLQRVSRGNRMLTRGRGGRVIGLPYWHPRTPLRDITALVRGNERRRAELNDDQAGGAPQDETNALTPSIAYLEQEFGASTPIHAITLKPQASPATQLRKIMIGIHNDNKPNSDFITPQKKLLDSIEKVREVWIKEQRKLEKTPSAKKAEREKKVRTLMSMR